MRALIWQYDAWNEYVEAQCDKAMISSIIREKTREI